MKLRGAMLPVFLLAAVAAGFLFPGVGAWLERRNRIGLSVQSWAIVVLFFVYGLRLQWAQWHIPRRWIPLAISAVVINLLLGPLVGLALAVAWRMHGGVLLGLLAMSCVPPTLSSGMVVTESAEGDVFLALFLTLLLTFAGLAIMPLTLAWTLRLGVHLSFPLGLFARRVAGLVLLPLLVGRLFQFFRRGRLFPAWLDLVPSLCVALVVFMPVSVQTEALRGLRTLDFLQILGATVSVHLLLMGAAAVVGKVLSASFQERVALFFVASQKTLPLALTALAALGIATPYSAMLSSATVVCVVFHISQLLLDSACAIVLRRRLSYPVVL